MDDKDDQVVPPLPPKVAATIQELFPAKDPLERLDFDATEYLNETFPTQQSLTNLEDVIVAMSDRISRLDSEISDVVRGMQSVESEGKEALQDAQQVILQLTSRIHEMKEQAVKSEQMVNEITADIKQLDNAKRNLTASIIMLNNLHILVDGVDKLNDLIASRSYGQTAAVLQSCLDVLLQLDKHQSIPQVRDLAEKVDSIRSKLSTQIISDFHSILDNSSNSAFQPNQLRLLAEACLVVDCLDSKVKKELLEWVVRTELQEYKVLFQENQDTAWLDKVDKRFNWLKKHLINFEERFGRIFPPKWEVSERIAIEFCKHTAKELSRLMSNRSYEIDVRNLLFAVSKSTAFEHLLAQKFPGLTITVDDVPDVKKKDFLEGRLHNPFLSIISHCFEPHLSIYVDAQDKSLSNLIDKLVSDDSHKTSTSGVSSNKNDPQSTTSSSQVLAEVFPSAGILFTQYKNSLVQCVQLSTGVALRNLAFVFQRNLKDYAVKVLQGSLPKLGASSASLRDITSLSSAVSGSQGVRSTASAAAGLFQSFLKEYGGSTFSNQDIITVCSVILTANYCLETTQQLEKKLKEKVSDPFKNDISLSNEQDLFHAIIRNSVQLLVSNFEACCEPSFTTMTKISWSSVGTPIGPSQYVVTMSTELQRVVPFVRENLSEAIKYFTLICSSFAECIVPKIILNLFKCKNVSQGGAEQLLLDTHTLKKVLLELPTHESVVKTAPVSYTKVVIKGMTRAEMILKVVLVPHSQVDSFIESYLKLLPDSETSEFMKILDMKGVKKTDSNVLLEVFRAKSLEKKKEALAQFNSVLNGSNRDRSSSPTSGSTTITLAASSSPPESAASSSINIRQSSSSPSRSSPSDNSNAVNTSYSSSVKKK